jgi:hypothetical protein
VRPVLEGLVAFATRKNIYISNKISVLLNFEGKTSI